MANLLLTSFTGSEIKISTITQLFCMANVPELICLTTSIGITTSVLWAVTVRGSSWVNFIVAKHREFDVSLHLYYLHLVLW